METKTKEANLVQFGNFQNADPIAFKGVLNLEPTNEKKDREIAQKLANEYVIIRYTPWPLMYK